jgi:hypothetical protein
MEVTWNWRSSGFIRGDLVKYIVGELGRSHETGY